MVELTLADFKSANDVILHSRDRVAEGILFAQIIGATVLQKIAIPLGGQEQIYLGFLVVCGAVAVGLATKRFEVNGQRLALFMMMFGGLTLTQLLGGHDYSIFSLALLLTLHAPYVLSLKEGMARSGIELVFFQKIMMVLALVGILQFFSQYVIGWHSAFYLDSTFPKAFIFQGFHGLNPLGYAGHIYKSNGVFFLEPAIFSQFLALSIIIEVTLFHSWKRILLYLAAILVTFSGTGLALLCFISPMYLIRQRRFAVLACLFLGIATISLWAPTLGLDKIVDRLDEFSNPNTSGYARFISIFLILRDFLLPQSVTFFFGMGAGSFKDIAGQVSYAVHDPGWGKIVFEYGLIGAFSYFPLMVHVFCVSASSFYLRAALAMQFLFLGEYVLSPTVHGLIIALLAWPAVEVWREKFDKPAEGGQWWHQMQSSF